MNLDNVTRDDWILGGLALVLAIVVVALPWFSFGGGTVASIPIPSYDLTATDAPDGWLGILALLALIALIADIAVDRLSPQTTLPSIGGSRTTTRFALAAAAVGFLALKFIFHLGHFSDLGFGFWVAVLVSIALVVVAERGRHVPALSQATQA